MRYYPAPDSPLEVYPAGVCALHSALDEAVRAHPRADGTTHLLLDPLELIEKIALLIPPPRFHSCAFMGCSARPRGGGRRSFRGAPLRSMTDPRRRGPARGRGRWRSRRQSLGVRRVSVLRGRRCGAGCSPWTCVSVPALRRPPADRGGAHRGREHAWGARAARARERVARPGRVALAAARDGVIAPAPRDRLAGSPPC